MTDADNHPTGQPVGRMVAMPADTNPEGDIFGGWLLAHMDLAGATPAFERAQGRCVTIALDAERGASTIDGDRDEIIQVIQNLVDNGIKYSAPGQSVEVSVRRGLALGDAPGPRTEGAARLSLLTPDREAGVVYAAVTVRDHGPGMVREHLPRLTERFYRVEGQKSGGDRPGTGLGLAIVKHIVNRHRGGLVVESAVGEGAAFTAYFPMHVAPVLDDPQVFTDQASQ